MAQAIYNQPRNRSRQAGGSLATATIDGGGQRVASASYAIDGSVGDIAGTATAAPNAARHGEHNRATENQDRVAPRRANRRQRPTPGP